MTTTQVSTLNALITLGQEYYTGFTEANDNFVGHVKEHWEALVPGFKAMNDLAVAAGKPAMADDTPPDDWQYGLVAYFASLHIDEIFKLVPEHAQQSPEAAKQALSKLTPNLVAQTLDETDDHLADRYGSPLITPILMVAADSAVNSLSQYVPGLGEHMDSLDDAMAKTWPELANRTAFHRSKPIAKGFK